MVIGNQTLNNTDFQTFFNESQENDKNISKVTDPNFCLTYCLPTALTLSTIAVVGMVTNLIVIIVIIRDKRLHTPTFKVICSLGIADFLFLFVRYPRYIVKGYFQKSMEEHQFNIFKSVCDVIGLIAGGSSIFHIIALAGFRYFIVVHPFKSHILLTNKLVVSTLFGLWMLAAAVAVFYDIAVQREGAKYPKLKEGANIAITVFMSFLPVILISSFHLMKAKVLLESISNCTRTVKNMSRVVTVVIVSFIVTTTPANAMDIMILSFGYHFAHSKWFFIFTEVARVFLFLNFTINPFIYFVHSKQLQKSITRCCRGKHGRHFGSCSSGCSCSRRHTSDSQRSMTSTFSALQEEFNNVQLQSCKNI